MRPGLNLLNFDRGLTEVCDTGGQALPTLPAQRQLDPAEAGVPPQFEPGLVPGGFDALIEHALCPPLPDRGLLRPAAFRSALEGACAVLQSAAASDPAHVHLLRRASRVLAEDLALRELAQMYRSALHQG